MNSSTAALYREEVPFEGVHHPLMADFALWAMACETALWPAGTFARAYAANRRAAIESIIEADPIATCVRAHHGRPDRVEAKNPRATLAGRLGRAQTFLRTLGI